VNSRFVACSLILLLAGLIRAEDVIDSPMYQMPALPGPKVEQVFPAEAVPLWLKALDRPEIELRIQAAEAIARARRQGVINLETTIAPLQAALNRSDQPASVRVALAKALVTLDARQTADSLFQQIQPGNVELRGVIEPALARWNYQPMRAVWLARLRDPSTPAGRLTLAIRGLATVGEMQALEPLHGLVFSDRVAGPIRWEAAAALGRLQPKGLEKDAEGLLVDGSPRGKVARLAAARLLQHHQGGEAIRVLGRMTGDPEPAVVALAARRLLDLDSRLLVPYLDSLLTNLDAEVRSIAVAALLKQPTEKHIRLLADRLDDDHMDVRIKARRALQSLAAKKELREGVLREATRMLSSESWRGLEQAAILLTQLDHKPAAPRLVELLVFDRPEVFITAAWGLRKLAIPATLPAVVQYIQAEKGNKISRKNAPINLIDHQISQLNQFIGQQKYQAADSLLRQQLPPRGQQPPLPESRAAAVWALGILHEGKPDPALAKILEERLNDYRSIPPEFPQVRLMSAITLARMEVREALTSIRKYYHGKPANDLVNNACGWAIARLTGEAMPPPETVRRVQTEWFLVPAR
jgi:HEAT repeat protein